MARRTRETIFNSGNESADGKRWNTSSVFTHESDGHGGGEKIRWGVPAALGAAAAVLAGAAWFFITDPQGGPRRERGIAERTHTNDGDRDAQGQNSDVAEPGNAERNTGPAWETAGEDMTTVPFNGLPPNTAAWAFLIFEADDTSAPRCTGEQCIELDEIISQIKAHNPSAAEHLTGIVRAVRVNGQGEVNITVTTEVKRGDTTINLKAAETDTYVALRPRDPSITETAVVPLVPSTPHHAQGG